MIFQNETSKKLLARMAGPHPRLGLGDIVQYRYDRDVWLVSMGLGRRGYSASGRGGCGVLSDISRAILMNDNEIKLMEERITAFHQLKTRRAQLRGLIEDMNRSVPASDSPFTGNTRESRQVMKLEIQCSPTLGGEAPVTVCLSGLHISACKFGDYIEAELEKQLAAVSAAIEKL